MKDLLTKLELSCLNDSAEKFFATQCNSNEAVCLLVAPGALPDSDYLSLLRYQSFSVLDKRL